MMILSKLKVKTYETGLKTLLERIATAEKAMKAAQEAANSEDKSSAGDKYETARAMGQLDRDMNARQLAEAKKELKDMQQLEILPPADKIAPGSLVNTSNGYFFIGAHVGPVMVEKHKIMIISAKSPLAKMLMHRKKGDYFDLNGKAYQISDVL